MINNTISPNVQTMLDITRNNSYSDKELWEMYKADQKRQFSPEYIDKYIYSLEHDFVKDGIVDWTGCTIDESWEEYKEKVGYYKRHPERKEESQAFTKEIMAWWALHLQEMKNETEE